MDAAVCELFASCACIQMLIKSTACAETRSDDLAIVVVARDLLGILERKRTFVRGNKGAHASPARHGVALARCREGIRLCKVHRFTRGKIAPVTGNAFHVL